MPEPTCTVKGVDWRDRASDPLFLRYAIKAGDGATSQERAAIPAEATFLDVQFLVGGPMPSLLVKEAQQAILARLQAVREQALAEDDTEARIAELLDRRRQLEDQLRQAEVSAAQARQRAAALVKQGQSSTKEERTALEADEHVRTLAAALGEVPRGEGIRGHAHSRLQGRIRAEAERIRAEVLQRQSQARARPPDAAGAWLIEIAVADRLAQLCAEPTAAQRSYFGSTADLDWLGRIARDLAPVSAYNDRSSRASAPVPSFS